MREFQERRRIKKFLHSRYAIGVLAVVCLILIHGVWGVFQKYEKSKEIAERVQANLSALETRSNSLGNEISALGTAEGKEREIRDRFGVVKTGEKMVVIVPDASATDQEKTGSSGGWWSRFLGFFGI